MTPRLLEAFLAWLVRRIAEALAEEQGAPVRESTVVAPRVDGQVSTRQGNRVRSGRQSNLNARPGTPLNTTRLSPDTALGDTNRRPAWIPPARGGAAPPKRYVPWPAVTPPRPETPSTVRMLGLGSTPYDGSPVPSLVLLPDTDAYNTPPADPHDALWHEYAGYKPIFGFEGHPTAEIYALQAADPQMIGPNWFPPYATTSHPYLYGMEIPMFTNTQTPYWCISNAFLGEIPTLTPNVAIKPVGSQFASQLHFADNVGWHYTIPYAQGEEAIIVDGDPVRTLGHTWPLSSTRGAVLSQWTPSNAREAWPVRRYPGGGSVGTLNLWRYSFSPGAVSTPAARDVTWYTLQDDGSGTPEAVVPPEFTRAGVVGLSDTTPTIPFARDVFNERTEIGWPEDDDHYTLVKGTIGAPSLRGMIHIRFIYNHDSGIVEVFTRLGLVAYSETTWETHELVVNPAGANSVNLTGSGAGYAFGGRLDRNTSDPTHVGPEPTAYDTEDDRTLHLRSQAGSLRLLAVEPDVTATQLRTWWVSDGRTHAIRTDAAHPPPDTRPEPIWIMGINWDGAPDAGGEATFGHANWLYNFKPASAPSVPTVGSFTPSNLGFASVPEGLRMSHQEVWSDFEDGADRTLGRIITLVPPSELHAYFPPTAPSPHDDWNIQSINDTEAAQVAAMIGRYLDVPEGSLPVPYGGSSGTFQGIPVDGTGTYTADALVAPDGTLIGVVAHEDGTVEVSEGGEITWTGTLSNLLGNTGLSVILHDEEVAPHARPLHPKWPYETAVLRISGHDIVIRARMKEDDKLVGHTAPIVVSHEGELDAA